MNEQNKSNDDSLRMPLAAALKVLADVRKDEIVVTTMGCTREWPKLSDHQLDFHFLPSTMGGGPPLGLGLALAQPDRHVITMSGDGSLLMSLGALVTIAASGAKNLTVLLFDNGVYEVTGGQRTAASSLDVDFAGIASAAGLPTALAFDQLDDWQRRAAETLQLPGPRFIALRTEPVRADVVPPPLGPIGPRIKRFQSALGIGQ